MLSQYMQIINHDQNQYSNAWIPKLRNQNRNILPGWKGGGSESNLYFNFWYPFSIVILTLKKIHDISKITQKI